MALLGGGGDNFNANGSLSWEGGGRRVILPMALCQGKRVTKVMMR